MDGGRFEMFNNGESVFIGQGAGANDDFSNQNVAIGCNSLPANTYGDKNTAVGYNSLVLNVYGSQNTAIGVQSLYANTSSYNTAVGYYTLNNNTTGQCNTAVGYYATVDYGNLYNASMFGYLTPATASNQVRIGNFQVTSIGGNVGWTTLADKFFQKNIKNNVPGLDFINKLNPVTYQVSTDAIKQFIKNIPDVSDDLHKEASEKKEAVIQSGFIAQEVEEAAQSLGFDFSGVDAPKNDHDIYGLRLAEFVVPLVKAVQEQQQMISNLEKRIEELESRLAKFEQVMGEYGSR